MSLAIRWITRKDLDEVLAIESASFEFPWTEAEFLDVLRSRNAIGIVAIEGGAAVGYAVYELHKDRMCLLNLAVDQFSRRCGVGRALVETMIGKLTKHRRTRISCEVRERNLAAQLFLKAMGFQAVAILRDFYDDTNEDFYQFRFNVKQPAEAECQGV